MLSSDETRAGGKPNQRKGKPAQTNKKGEQRNRKTAQLLETKPDQAQDAQEEMRVEAMSAPVITAADPAAAPSSTETVPASSPGNRRSHFRQLPLHRRCLGQLFADVA